VDRGGLRIIDAATGEVLRELTLDLNKRYPATGGPQDQFANDEHPNPGPWTLELPMS